MSVLLLMAAAALWLWSARSGQVAHARLAAALHSGGVVATLILRSDLLPAGWSSAAVIAVWFPGLLAAIRPAGSFGRVVRAPLGLLTLASALWSGAALGPGVALWAPWALPHILLSVLGVGAAAGAALVAVQRVRGRAVPLLAAACVITAAPLLGPRAATVQVYADGAPAAVSAHLIDPAGGQGLVRMLPARAHLPYERPLRQAAGVALLVGVFFALAGMAGGALRWLVLPALGLHAALLASALIPRDLGVEAADVVSVARQTLLLEAGTVESVGAVSVAAGPFTGGLGAPALLLPLALVALWLAWAAFAAPLDESVPAGRARRRAEALMAMGAALLLGAGAAAGMVWSNYRWGGPVLPDPKVFAVIVTLGLYGLYFLIRNLGSAPTRGTAWVALAAFGLLLLSMFGPDLGWIAPGLHRFGA